MNPDTNNEVAATPATMNPQEINRRIAIACGWKHQGKTYSHGRICDTWGSPNGEVFRSLPNYHGDLNAMHEAEKVLTPWQSSLYLTELIRITADDESTPHAIHATAAQRAEAFLRTIGQWEEAK